MLGIQNSAPRMKKLEEVLFPAYNAKDVSLFIEQSSYATRQNIT